MHEIIQDRLADHLMHQVHKQQGNLTLFTDCGPVVYYYAQIKGCVGRLLDIWAGVCKVVSFGYVLGFYDVNLQHSSRHRHILYALHE